MDFIPTRHHARTLTKDDGTLCLHKQPIIMMMNGCGHMAIVSLSSYMPAYQYEMDHQITPHYFLWLWSIVSPINIQLPRPVLITWDQGQRSLQKVTCAQ